MLTRLPLIRPPLARRLLRRPQLMSPAPNPARRSTYWRNAAGAQAALALIDAVASVKRTVS